MKRFARVKKNIALIAGVIIIVIAGAIILFQSEKKTSNTSTANADIVYFYGDGCPHCAKVETFLKENNANNKVTYQKLEVWSNTDNATLMSAKAKICSVDESSIGVPFLFIASEKKCLMGDADVIAYFQKKINGQ